MIHKDIWYTNSSRYKKEGFNEQDKDAILILDIIRMSARQRVQHEGARNGAQKSARQSVRHDIAVKDESQRCKT